jgi:hypothetical protein
MAPSNEANSTQLTVIDTEHALGSAITTAGDYICGMDLTPLADGDEIELRVKIKAFSGESSTLYWLRTYAHAQEELLIEFPPIGIVTELVYTLTQTAGSVRTFTWWVTKL